MYHKGHFVVGDPVEFTYNGKLREGIVESVKPTCVTLQIGDKCRSFCYGGIVNLKVLVEEPNE